MESIEMDMFPQDLHMHTTYSTGDDAVVPEQTVALIAAVKHARIVGISDHVECLVNGSFEAYAAEVRGAGLKVSIEVDGHPWVPQAAEREVDYRQEWWPSLDFKGINPTVPTGHQFHPGPLFS